MKGTGPAHLFVYYQMPYQVNEAGEVEDVKGAHKPQFYVTDGMCALSSVAFKLL